MRVDLTAAGATERAVDQWLNAGQHAARSAPHEAIGHLERGIAMLAALPEGFARDEREIELHLARGLSLFTAEGFMSTEASRSSKSSMHATLFDFATLKRKSGWSTPVSPAPPQVALPQPPCIAAR